MNKLDSVRNNLILLPTGVVKDIPVPLDGWEDVYVQYNSTARPGTCVDQ